MHPADAPLAALSAPPAGPRARTWRLLLDEAVELMREGQVPSVADVAARAGVSRATAYRYFPSRSKLISAVVDHSLGPVRRFRSTREDGRERIQELFDHTFPRFKEFEPQLRAALQLSLEHDALERAGRLAEEPYRRGHRTRILSDAAAPLKATLGAKRFSLLLRALSLVYGIESYVVLRDIWGSSDREIAATAHWMVDALVAAALRDAQAEGPPPRAPRQGPRQGQAPRQAQRRAARPAPQPPRS